MASVWHGPTLAGVSSFETSHGSTLDPGHLATFVLRSTVGRGAAAASLEGIVLIDRFGDDVSVRSRSAGRKAAGVVLTAAAFLGSITTPVGAQGGQLDPVELFEFFETGEESPLAPGIAHQLHFEMTLPIPMASDDGFFTLLNDAEEFDITEISIDGQQTHQTVIGESDPDASVRALQLTDDYLLAETLTFDGLDVDSVLVFRLDRATGEMVPTAPSTDTTGSARMSPDGDIVANGFIDPYWASIANMGGDGSHIFTEDGFESYQSVASLSADGQLAAVAGARTVGDDISSELWVNDVTGATDDLHIELPCPSASCEYEINTIATRDSGASVLLTGYSLEPGMGPTVRIEADHYEVFLADGRVESSVPVTVVSPNGRYVVGMATTDDSLELSTSDVVVHDLVTGRQRSFSSDLPASYAVEPLGVSDDGQTIRYVASIPCPAGQLCVLQPSYFGHFELLPVADVTAGPAADQILRLYRAVFGRIPDEGGFNFWMRRYREGEPLLGTAGEFALSQEFADRFGENPTDAELIAALYQNTLGRDGDAGGVAFWLDRRADGMTIAELLIAFSDSPENIERTGTRNPVTVPEGRVLRVYRAVLGRDPDDGGLAFWVSQYNGGLSLAEMAEQFTFQSEYEVLYGENPTDAELVDAVYRNVLGRDGDPGGVAFWLDRMAQGLTAPELFVSFAESPENIENTGTVR